MRFLGLALIVAAFLLAGCDSKQQATAGSINDTNPPVRDQAGALNNGADKPNVEPGGIGVTGGATGTGTTSGSSTGY